MIPAVLLACRLAVSATVAEPPSTTAVVEPSATVLAAPRAESATLSETPGNGGAKIRVRRAMYAGSDQVISLIVPDGDGMMVVENRIGASSVRMGAHYNFFNGTVQAWITYGLDLVGDALTLQVSASDDIGFGTIYRGQRYLQRAQSVPVGLAWNLPVGVARLSAGRTRWRLAVLDDPARPVPHTTDAVDFTLQINNAIPDLVRIRRPDATTFAFRHAFRGFGGEDRFDKADLTLAWKLPGLRAVDDGEVRAFVGQGFNERPALSLRESYLLGGATSLRGYGYREFLGSGVRLLTAEYSLGLPIAYRPEWIPAELSRTALTAFADAGWTQSRWLSEGGRTRASGGGGVRLDGKLLKGHPVVFRAFVAQAAESDRAPVFYALFDLK